jgi:hypothetical protein
MTRRRDRLSVDGNPHRPGRKVMAVNAVYVIFAVLIGLLMLPLLVGGILVLGPVAFVVLLIAVFALPVYLVAGARLRR